MSGIGLIHNPNAKKNKNRRGLAEKFAKILSDFGVVRVTRNLNEISEVAKEFLDREIDILMVNGGDGTCYLTLTKFIEVYGKRELPLIVHMRGGTLNTVAHALDGIKGAPEEIVLNVVDKYRRNEPFTLTERNIVKVSSFDGFDTPSATQPKGFDTIGTHLAVLTASGPKDLYGFIIGSGLVANFIKAYNEGGGRGPIKAAKLILKGVYSAILRTDYSQKLVEPLQAKIFIAGRKLPSTQYTTILASSIREIGLGFKPAYLAGKRDGFFHFVCGNLPALEIVKNLPKIRLGKPIVTRELYDEVCKEVTIKTDGEFRCMVDGDIYRCAGDVKITTGPRLKFIRS